MPRTLKDEDLTKVIESYGEGGKRFSAQNLAEDIHRVNLRHDYVEDENGRQVLARDVHRRGTGAASPDDAIMVQTALPTLALDEVIKLTHRIREADGDVEQCAARCHILMKLGSTPDEAVSAMFEELGAEKFAHDREARAVAMRIAPVEAPDPPPFRHTFPAEQRVRLGR